LSGPFFGGTCLSRPFPEGPNRRDPLVGSAPQPLIIHASHPGTTSVPLRSASRRDVLVTSVFRRDPLVGSAPQPSIIHSLSPGHDKRAPPKRLSEGRACHVRFPEGPACRVRPPTLDYPFPSPGHDKRAPPNSPFQQTQFPRERPIVRLLDQSCPNRIILHVLPFFVVILICPQLPIPKRSLPNGMLFRAWPPSRCHRFPTSYPIVERSIPTRRRSTKKVDVVRHDHVATHDPARCLLPAIQQQRFYVALRQDPLSAVSTHRDKNDDWRVRYFNRR